ncbi:MULTISPECIES: Rv2578c family radical SAM protein [Microbacterium]|uniref:Rv2578c family radical SAM protein n=1 Tax=Microbacterium TaxID=33882 RepID=UPI00217D9DE4|nr:MULTISPECIES: Rv2578c family radical SAM protein [Microbacterium]UWF77698.1 Rv2578c family radical SAM protein [Microbacterium neungamense]WCM55867.1 Rv2578c family radical SAM protein [Microbacterium sp. EF45047]
MRWQGQAIDETDGDALPGLENRSGLVRSVTTPEFAGVTFHEVLARSALNRVPGPSRMPFNWTINPYRGCSHACVYCLDPATPVLCTDGRQRPIGELEVGMEIIGTEIIGTEIIGTEIIGTEIIGTEIIGREILGAERRGAYRRYVRTSVEAKWSTRKAAYRVTLADGTTLIASGDHRFLTERGWKHVADAHEGQRPHLTSNDRLMGLGTGFLAEADLTGLEGTAVTSVADLVSIEPLPGVRDLVDITTGTGDFVANGVISHNCFARGTHEYLDLDGGADFDSQIVVKTNIVEVLQRELRRGSWQRETVALGTNTDPYQRAEGRYRLMPGIIRALADSGTPMSILTKGTLIRRDIPLLRDAATQVPIDVQMSIAMYDDALQHSIEPGTPTTQARLDTVHALTDAGFRVGVFLMPVLPHLTDSIAAIDDALRRIKEAGADHAVYGALHLRPGVKPWFFQWLQRERPDLVSSYRGLYPGAAVEAPKAYRQWLAKRMRPLIRAHGLHAQSEQEHDQARSILRMRTAPPAATPAPAPTLF